MTFATEVEADAPTLWWDTRQASGTSQPDRAGNGHTGTITGTPALSTDGLTFDNTSTGDDEFIVADTATDWTSPSICFEAVGALTGLANLIGLDTAGTPLGNIGIYLTGSNVIGGFYSAPGGGLHSLGAAASIDSALHHFAVDLDGAGLLSIYLDGALIGSNDYSPDDSYDAGINQLFVLANDLCACGDGSTGLIRHGIVYDHGLGATRIAAHAAAALGDDPAPPGGGGGGSMLDTTATLRSLTMGTGTDYIIEEPGITGLGTPDTKTADSVLGARDGSFGAPDFLDVRVITIPILILGADAADAFDKLDALNAAWEPCRDGVDIDLDLSLPGRDVTLVGRPRGVVDDCSEMGQGTIRALCRFDGLDPNFHTGS